MNYNSTYAGHYFQMVNGDEYSFNASGKMATVSVEELSSVNSVLLTGYYLTTTRGNTMYQTTKGTYIDLTDGWQDAGTGSVFKASQKSAQSLVDEIIKNNKKIIANNILCARFANKLTDDQKTTLRDLQLRLQARNSSLRDDGICTDLKESYPQGYVYVDSYLENFMNGVSGVGVIATSTIIIAAVVVAALSTAAYFAYKAMAAESAQDVKYSDELTKVLTSKLTDEEYQQLMEETQGIVTKSKIKASLGSYSKVVVLAGVAVAGLFAYRWLSKNLNK